MQIEFLRDRAKAQIGQKADSMPAAVVSAVASTAIPFGALVVFDDSDAFLCKLPASKAHIEKPLGIALRQLHSHHYEAKSSVAALRKGRVWIEADKVSAPGDVVYIKFGDDGSLRFSGDKKDNVPLKGAIFLEKSEGGLTPIEVNFFGGVQ